MLVRRDGFVVFLFALVWLFADQGPAEQPGKAPDKRPTADNPDLARVLLIGDSISMGYTKPTRRLLAGKAEVHRVPGNAGHTGMGLAGLPKWLDEKHGKWDVIHFNWGLWDLCYRSTQSQVQGRRDKVHGKLTHTPEQYAANLEQIVTRLEQTGAKLIFATTTPVPEGEAGRKVGDDVKYNAAALDVMKKHGVRINDLHAVMAPHMKKYQVGTGNVHFKPDTFGHFKKDGKWAERDDVWIFFSSMKSRDLPTSGRFYYGAGKAFGEAMVDLLKSSPK